MADGGRIEPEVRATNIPNEAGVATSDPRIAQIFGLLGGHSSAGVPVTLENALGVPAVWAAVNFMAGTLAGLPLHVYRRDGAGRKRVGGALSRVLHRAVNDEMSSFDWRKYTFERVFTGGRGFSYIERTSSGQIINIWPLEPEKMTIRRENMRKTYDYRDSTGPKTYSAAEVIDIPFMFASDGVAHKSPILTNKDAIGQAIAAQNYAARFFANGGVPPFAVTGNFQSAGALGRAAEDLFAAVKKAASEGRHALTLPAGLEIKSIGVDPEKSQLVDLQRFMVVQIGRIYSLPPTFLQDLTYGTFSNTEQQDLHFVKHTLKRWADQFEGELNLKIFGRGPSTRFVKLNMDGLLRGDFKTRMDGNARAIGTGQLTPNEARELDDRQPLPGGNKLLIQGATVPLDTEGENDGT